MNLLAKHVPKQVKGFSTGATSRTELASRHLALHTFNKAKQKLLAVNSWYSIAGNKGAEFQLTDRLGQSLDTGTAEAGQLIRIKLPAPPNQQGDSFDWVQIETVVSDKDQISDEEIFGFHTRPVANPTGNSDKSAHFYKNDATSSFLVYRKIHQVYVMERGRNELPNPAGSWLNRLRNLLVAIPAMLGFSKPQWKALTNGILTASKNNNY